MTIEEKPSNEALIKPVRTISKVWLFPIVALLVGIWMVYYQWSNQGPLITIEFSTATGLEAGKTKIKTRDLNIGTVKKIELTEDLERVKVTARLDSNVESLLHKDNQFWIVSPRVSLNGISGLGTILSGPYINMEPGVDQELSEEFIALPAPPITKAGTPGLHITLNSESEFSYKKGDPVIYKGIKVGEFEDIYFNFDERIIYYNTFIEAPYHDLITENTQFWDISGVNLQVGSAGVSVKTGSLETLLTNGVTFGVPEGVPTGEKVTERSFFKIHHSYELALEERYKLNAEYLMLIDDTVRGLQVGAPVEYRGLVIGKVLAINIGLSSHEGLLEDSYDIPIVIGIQPGRVGESDNQNGLNFVYKQIDLWIEKGLRASLKTGNLLTGSLFVDLQHYDDLPKISNTKNDDFRVMPIISGEFSQITEKVTAILDNINQIKLKKISENADVMLNQIGQAAQALQTTAGKLDIILTDVHQDKVSGTLVNTLESISGLTGAFSEDSQTFQQLNQTMQTLQQTMKELQPLLLQLKNKPNSLIFSDAQGPQFIPKAKLINQGNTK